MVTLRTSTATVLGLAIGLAALGACQALAGIEDKELDPSLGAGAGGASGSGGSNGLDAGADAPKADADAQVEGDAKLRSQPPGRPPGDAAPGEGGTLAFGVRRFFLGSYDPETDSLSTEAWRNYGHDYDGECTSLANSQVNESATCQRPLGSNPATLEDGTDCRDNTSGHLISTVVQLVDSEFELKVHKGTESGTKQTIILQIDDVNEGPDDPYAPGRLYVSAPQANLLWSGNDLMRVDKASLENGDLAHPSYELPGGYIRNHVWVSGDFKGAPMIMPLMVLNHVVAVPTITSILVVHLSEDRLSVHSAQYTGVLHTDELEPYLRAGMLEATCDTDSTELGMDLFMTNKDLGREPSFVNGGEDCNRLSMAMGLDLKRVRPPVEAVDVPAIPSSCDAGTD